MKTQRLFSFAGLISLLIFLAACEEAATEEQKEPKGPSPAIVETTSIDEDTLPVERRFLGEVRSARTASLAAGGSGEVIRVTVAEGDSVSRNEVVLQLDDTLVRRRLGQAEAGLRQTEVQLAQAERDAERLATLARDGYSAASESEQLQTRRDSLVAALAGHRAEVARLREEVDQHRVRAAFDGTVTRRLVDPGDWVQPGQSVVEVVSGESREVFVRVPSTVLDELSDEPGVRLTRAGESIGGRIGGIVGALDPRSRTALIRILPDVSPDWLRDGGTVDVTLKLERTTDGVVVPTDALVYGVAGVRVIRAADGKAEPVDVVLIARSGDRALVETGQLALGDRVVVRGNERVRPGQPLEERR
ncbi:MAG: efflux RND transporter periplasmic adaptor subunit [Myxococcota bacterium]